MGSNPSLSNPVTEADIPCESAQSRSFFRTPNMVLRNRCMAWVLVHGPVYGFRPDCGGATIDLERTPA
ncbi:MAG: hypothetical protein U0T81_11120 [Saprospiraceae bacterium]